MRSRPYLVALAALAGLGALVGWVSRDDGLPDFRLFAAAGHAILSGRWGQVYDDPTVQAGPFALLLAALCDRLGGVTFVCMVGIPLATLAAALATRLLRHGLRRPRSRGLELAAAAVTLAWESALGAVLGGHVAQGLIPMLWVGTGLAVLRRRPQLAGWLLALSTGFEVWGALGVPLLLLGTRRDAVRGLAVTTAGAVALYLPFTLAGPFRMFDYQWVVTPGSLPARVGLFGDGLPWWARCAQAALAVGAGALVVRFRRDWDAVWLAPLVVVAVRLALDPQAFTYYWTPLVALGLAGVLTAPSGSPPTRVVLPVLLVGWPFLPVADGWVGLLVVTMPIAAVLTRPGAPVTRAFQAGNDCHSSGRFRPVGVAHSGLRRSG
ncbi:hypothetical protein ACIB24_18515 [Spongisporangium articulatum]|uniref:DUF2029 domain-containing protein n=1 Tax=Spongisporangium articulatum TaxID=3362603 RepID=A0ABW8ARP4_9ACTN